MPILAVNLARNVGMQGLALFLFDGEDPLNPDGFNLAEIAGTYGRFEANVSIAVNPETTYRAVVTSSGEPVYEGWYRPGVGDVVDQPDGPVDLQPLLDAIGAVSGGGGDGGVVVVPLLGQIQSRTEGSTIRVFTRETTTLTMAVVNAMGEPVDLSGLSLSLIIERASGGDLSVIEDAGIIRVDGSISFMLPAEVSAAEGHHAWALRSDDGAVLMHGPLIVEYAPEVGP
jgi:hypothetical protein